MCENEMEKTQKSIQNRVQKGSPKHQKYVKTENQKMMASNDDPGGGARRMEKGVFH